MRSITSQLMFQGSRPSKFQNDFLRSRWNFHVVLSHLRDSSLLLHTRMSGRFGIACRTSCILLSSFKLFHRCSLSGIIHGVITLGNTLVHGCYGNTLELFFLLRSLHERLGYVSRSHNKIQRFELGLQVATNLIYHRHCRMLLIFMVFTTINLLLICAHLCFPYSSLNNNFLQRFMLLLVHWLGGCRTLLT